MYNDFFGDELLKDVIHYCLECCQTICEAEEHNEQFEQCMVGLECGFPFIAFLHLNIVETSLDVQFCEVLSSPKFGYQVWNACWSMPTGSCTVVSWTKSLVVLNSATPAM